MQESEGRLASAEEKAKSMPWAWSLLRGFKVQGGDQCGYNYFTGLWWEFLTKYTKPLGELQSTLQISVFIIAVVPQSVFVRLPSDPKGLDKSEEEEETADGPRLWKLWTEAQTKSIFSMGDAGECMCALETGSLLRSGEDSLGQMGDLWPVLPLPPFSQGGCSPPAHHSHSGKEIIEEFRDLEL